MMHAPEKPAICFSLPRAQHESSHICCRGWHSLPQGNSGSLQEASAAARACGLHDQGQQGNSCWSWHVRLAATTDTLHRIHNPWCCCGAGQAQHHRAAAVGSSAAQVVKCGAVKAGSWGIKAQTPWKAQAATPLQTYKIVGSDCREARAANNKTLLCAN